ncbi:MAG: phage tail sheath family protein [Clostridia bacterium]
MAGGTWTTQNKVRPGVYINFESEPKPVGNVGERGVVTMALPLNWGESKQVITLQASSNLVDQLGYDRTAPEMLLICEVFKRARTLLLYRLNTGTKAAATQGDLVATAKYGGARGNDITLVIQPNLDDNTKFDVRTLLDGKAVDQQLVANVSELNANQWVAFSGTGSLTATAGLPLTGGTNGTVTNQDHTDYLAAIEVHDFQTLALPSSDSALKSLYTAFTKRQREEEGKKIQTVLAQYPLADSEGVISVKNGVVLADGTVLDAVQATAWVAGATAGAEINESLTYQAYDDAVDVQTRYTNTQVEEALKNGEFVFVPSKGRAIVEQDINTLKSFTPDKRKHFSKNRVIRVLDGIANDFKRIFEASYIGEVDNNADGRNLFRQECIAYLETLQGISAVQNVSAKDVIVEAGNDSDSISVDVTVQPVDAIEKIYMKVQVK